MSGAEVTAIAHALSLLSLRRHASGIYQPTHKPATFSGATLTRKRGNEQIFRCIIRAGLHVPGKRDQSKSAAPPMTEIAYTPTAHAL